MQPREGMVKLIYSSAFDNTVDVGVRLIEDPRQLTKSASTIFNCDYEDLRPDKDHVGIHLVALGDFEHFGSNRNGDSFPKSACIKYHDTFVKNGNVYRHHRNKDSEKRLGQVVKSAYNDPMGRIELFIHAHKEKAQDELEKLARDGEVAYSMACLKAGTLVTTDKGLKPIEVLEIGTPVLTRTGQWGVVGNRSVRHVTEYVQINLISWGRISIPITANHKVLAASFDQFERTRSDSPEHMNASSRRRHRKELHTKLQMVPAGELTEYHYMAAPIDRLVSGVVDPSWARVLGYYIAEGSFGDGVTTFTCGIDDDAVAELPRLAAWTSVTIRPKAESTKAVSVDCFGTELRNSIEQLCGRRGENKIIPELIRHADIMAKFNFVATWFNGDGWQDGGGLHWSTHYQGLAVELQQLLASLDIASSCTRIDHPDDRGIVVSEAAVEYVVSISNGYSEMFSDISKAEKVDIYGESKCQTFISGDYLMVPVKSVIQIKEECDVFNFSVETHESYTAYGLAVSNCRVPGDRCSRCQAFRKSASDPKQCDHVRDELGKVGEDGKITCTHNDDPTFFDISFVTRPADRIAWNLKTASGEILDSVKVAEVEGLVIPDHIAITSHAALDKYAILKKMASCEKLYGTLTQRSPASTSEYYMWELRKAASARLSDNVLTSMRDHEPQDVFHHLAKSGVIMDVESFFKYALGEDYKEIKDDMPIIKQATKGIYGSLLQRNDCQGVCNDNTFDADPDMYTLLHIKGLDKLAEVTFIGPDRDQRVIDATINNTEIRIDNIVKISSNSTLTVDKLAERYAAYKLAAVQAISSLNKDTDTDALIAIATAQNLVN